jgi:hypothetical protein
VKVGEARCAQRKSDTKTEDLEMELKAVIKKVLQLRPACNITKRDHVTLVSV